LGPGLGSELGSQGEGRVGVVGRVRVRVRVRARAKRL